MKNVDGLLQKGVAALQSGRMRDAERAFRQAVEIAPRHFGALNLLTVALTGLERFDEAQVFAERALRIDASSDATHYNYGTVLKHNNKLDLAIAAFDAALAINPRHAKALNNRGAVYSQLERYEEALADFDRALALDRRYADAHYNKANALAALKRREEALRNFELTLSLNPGHAGAYANLLILFNTLGEYDKAVECGRRSLALQPDSADVLLNLASAELGRTQREAALRWLGDLLAKSPDNILALSMRVAILTKLDREDEAHADVEQLESLAPRDTKEAVQKEDAIANLLLAEGRYEDGIAALDRAIALGGESQDDLRAKRASTMETFGRLDEARAAFDDALALNPSSASAMCGRAELVKFTADDPTIPAMEALLAPEKRETHASRMLLHFALGKAYLDLGDSSVAFGHLDEGNRMKRAIAPYNADKTHKFFAEVAAAFTPALLDRLADQGLRSAAPIFIVGMPRSGTTLIEQILAAHPAVQGAGELRFMRTVVEQVSGFPNGVAALDGGALTRLGQAYLSHVESLAGGRPRVVDKAPGNFVNAGLIRLILPDAKIIHARRDPVDTCLSCYTKLFADALNFTYDLTELGRYCRDYQKMMDHWRAVLPASHFLEVDYEAVVDDIEAEARRMLEFLELPWNPACLEFYRVERPVRTASVNQVRQPIYRSSSGRWRKHADALQPLLKVLEIETA
jgi:tetratricopeptide (TPR) repeat protein